MAIRHTGVLLVVFLLAGKSRGLGPRTFIIYRAHTRWEGDCPRGNSRHIQRYDFYVVHRALCCCLVSQLSRCHPAVCLSRLSRLRGETTRRESRSGTFLETNTAAVIPASFLSTPAPEQLADQQLLGLMRQQQQQDMIRT